MPDLDTVAGEFAFEQTWDAMQELLADQLISVDVAAAGERDFDDEGNLILQPPAVRGLFVLSRAEAFENQKTAYNETQQFAVMCVEEDLSGDAQEQRRKSGRLAARVKRVLVGARLRLADGETAGPVAYTGVEPFEVAGVGKAYIVGFEVSGIAQFQGGNA